MHGHNPRTVNSTGKLQYEEVKTEWAGNYPIKLVVLKSEHSRWVIEIPNNYERDHIDNMIRDYNNNKRSFSFINALKWKSKITNNL